ncbi:MAG: ABC transporter ATP-binding protein [Gemmatimonadota bacterium]
MSAGGWWQRTRQSLRLGRALKLVTAAAPKWTAVSLGLVVVQAVLPLVSLYLMKLVVDAVTEGLARPDPATAFPGILGLIAIAGGVALATAVTRSLSALASEAQTHHVTDHVMERLHEKSLEVDLSYYEDPRYFDTLHRAQREGPSRPQRVLGNLLSLGQSGITLVGIFVLLVAVHWILAAVLFLAVIPVLVVRVRFSNETYRWQVRRAGTQRKANYVHWLLTTQDHAKEIRLLDLGPWLGRWFSELRTRLRTEILSLSWRRGRAEILTQLIASVVVFGSYGFIAYRTLAGGLTLGDLVMYFGAVQRGQALLQSTFTAVGGLYEDNLFIGMLDEFLTLEPVVRAPDHPAPVPATVTGGFHVDGVSFRYPSSERDLLEDVSLEVAPGEMVALIGANGSGKTTLVKLLCRFYDPDEGAILLDGTDIRRMDPREYRRKVAVVFQDFSRYQMSARMNIQLGAIDRDGGDEEIEDAARASGAHRLIAGLPRGYDTMLVADDRAVLVISHRFSTVRMADRIYVMNEGRIIESGTHESLMTQRGTYAHLFEVQASAYWPGASSGSSARGQG